MRRCDASTANGRRCLKGAAKGSRFCATHLGRVDVKQAALVTAAAAAGHLLLPGIGGLVAGAAAGLIADKALKEETVARKRVFVSFDFENDRILKEFLVGQSKLPDSPFEIVDCSLKEAAPMKTWEDKACRAIKGADLVIVMVGAKTHKAHGVLKEVAMARKEGVKIVQMIGRKGESYSAVPDAGRLYAWSWENLKKLLS